MPLNTNSNIEELQARRQNRQQLADAEDISAGVTASVGDISAFTIFLDVAGTMNIRVEFSADAGQTWYEPRGESPLEFSGPNTDLVFVDYVADAVRLTGSNGTAVTAEVREVA